MDKSKPATPAITGLSILRGISGQRQNTKVQPVRFQFTLCNFLPFIHIHKEHRPTMAGSQLTQLKTALTSAGLNRKNSSKKDKKAFKKGGARETDRAKTLAKLEDIRKNLNKFDVRETKVNLDIPTQSGKADL